jgi:hypothetical protein
MLNAGIQKLIRKLSMLGILVVCLTVASSEGAKMAAAATCCSACTPNYHSCLNYCGICGCNQQLCIINCNNYRQNCASTCDPAC